MRLIDADALRDLLQSLGYDDWNQGASTTWAEAFGEVAEMVADAPTVDVRENAHGKWKPFDLTWGRNIYACTACGGSFDVPTEMGKPVYAYCPHCGAKMEEEKNETNRRRCAL